jgi:hypothetical protein
MRTTGTCVCFLALGLVVQAGNAPSTAVVKRLAQELGTATIRGDYAKVIDGTYDKIVQELGGREKAIKVIESGMRKLRAKGITFKAYKVGDPGDFHREGNNTFVVVPTVLEMSAPGNKLIAKSYLLGISGDGGKNWKFVDGAGMDKQEVRERVLPKLPPKLKLPAKEAPKVVGEK